MHLDNIKRFRLGGLDTDSSPPDVDPNDYIFAENTRNTGTGGQDSGYSTNIESNTLLAGMLLAGLNDCNGGGAFEDIRQAAIFRTNSAGNNQILLYDYDSNTYTPIYTDVTDSGGEVLLPLDPSNWVNCILINNKYLIWTARNLEVGYTNLQTLASGGYGTVLAEDLMLLKPQCMIPPTGVYGSDDGQPANYLYGKLPQFIAQYVNDDFNYSAWSTRSKRIVPYQQNTPVLGVDVTQNNYIIVSVNIGSVRTTTLNIGCQFEDLGIFSQIKTVQRSYVVALTHTSVDVATEVFEAYNPTTNLYSFAFYNNALTIPIPATETDLAYDYIWPSNSSENINGNIAAIADWTTLYDRPSIPVTIAAVGYNPNIAIPAGTYPDPLRATGNFPGASGSGAGNHRRIMSISIGGTPHTGDTIIVRVFDLRNASSIKNYNYVVPMALDGDLLGVVTAYTPILPSSSFRSNGDGTYTITWTDDPYFQLQLYNIELFFGGASVANSIPSVLDNTGYTLALGLRDKFSRYFPLDTDNQFMISTPSYAQLNGNATEISWAINNATAPQGAFDAQWLITVPPVTKVLDTIATILNYKGAWNAATNSPALAINSGNIGDTYQITTPASPAVPVSYHDLGNNASYPTGDYVTNVGGSSDGSANGQYYSVLPRTFGNLAGTGSILVFSLNSLALLNQQYSDENVNTNLVYDFAPGDRCTLHYWIDGGGNINYFNQPCIDLTVLGFDAGTNLVKIENSSALTFASGHTLYNGQEIDAKNIFMRLYSPAPVNTTQSQTVWYEIGERITITDGLFDTLTGNITDGGAYYKTRQFPDGVLPYTNPPISVLATDLHYSDFYVSNYWSKGRPRTFYDELENTERKANIITSQKYITGSRVNGLNRYYPANIYGDGDGQCSSSQGAIQVMYQRGDVLVVGQEQNFFYIPVNMAYQILNDQLTGIAISEKLLNNGRYETKGIGIGRAKESFCKRYDVGYFVSPFDSQPMEITLAGVQPISGKMSKYFKATIQAAYALGKRLHMYYDTYYEEVAFCIQSSGSIIKLFPFGADWNPDDSYVLVPGDITATTNGGHCTVSYDSGTGLATYTPTTNYVGSDTATFTFNPGITKNVCLNWTAGSGEIDAIYFNPQTGVPLSTLILSNTGLVFGMDYPVAISVTGGEYSVNGGAFTSSAGTVKSGDIVQVRQTSSASYGTMTTTVLTITSPTSTLVANFNVTTTDAGNFTAYAQYGMIIDSVTNGTGTGVPAGYNPCNLTPGQSKSAVYTTLSTGTYIMTLDGMPSIPGHVAAFMSVNGVDVQVYNLTGPTILTFTLGTAANSPDIVLFSIRTHS